MIEAEGCVHVAPPQPDRTLSKSPRIFVVNTDVEIIATLLRLVGDGIVYLHKSKQARADGYARKPLWIWALATRSGFRDLAPQIAPYMTAKGDKIMGLL